MSRLRYLLLLGLAFLSGCGSVIAGPLPVDRITITLRITGGFAGVDHVVVVDGSRLEMRVACFNACTGLVDRLPLSPQQIASLARRLDDAGFPALDGSDFGNQCCDFFHATLTFERDGEAVHAQGTLDLWPQEMTPILLALSELRYGVVQAIVAPESDPSEWPADPFALNEVLVDGLLLRAEVAYTGGCADHPMDLVVWGGWLESFPVQVNALMSHEDNDDPCDAYPTSERIFDLTPVRDAYVEAYGSGSATIVLRLRDPNGDVLMLEVSF